LSVWILFFRHHSLLSMNKLHGSDRTQKEDGRHR
jgi:hypothetical protein